jgi:uncharacterized OB-fold protein
LTTVPFPPDVFTWPADEPQLIGAKCGACDAIAFPMTTSCPRCGTPEPAQHLLPRRGTLYTWTTQDFLPKEPYASGETNETFQPYGVGLVQLGDEVKVEARLTVADPEELDVGMEVELVVVPVREDDDATIVPFAFAPVEG